jgi:hypothetical protein
MYTDEPYYNEIIPVITVCPNKKWNYVQKLCYVLVHSISFLTGPEPAREAVLRARDGVRAYTPHPPRIVPCAPIPDGPPPPYTPTNHIENSPYNPYYTSHSSPPQVHCMGSASENSNPFHFSPQSFGSYRSPEARDDGSTRDSSDSNSSNRNPFHQDDSSRYVFKYVNKM